MVGKLRQLSSHALSFLQAASCIGTQFDLDSVAQLCAMSEGEQGEALAEVVGRA